MKPRNTSHPTTLRRLLLPLKRLKRRIVNRRGDGVHSPYAFHIINKVINCRYPFYCFEEIRHSIPQAEAKVHRRLRLHEAVFRLVHHHGQGDVMLYAQPDSWLVQYLQHLRPNGGLHVVQSTEAINPRSIRIVILESLLPHAVDSTLQMLQSHLRMEQELILIAYTQSADVATLLHRLGQECAPRASFDLIDLQLWVWRGGLTPGRYKGIVK